jgi:Nucleotidyltransferase of unknown function (DUF6036)
MNKTEIETYLAQLGQTLKDVGIQQPVRLLLIGGAFMLLRVGNRRTTDDIDVVLMDIEDTATSPLYRQFRAAVGAVAASHQLRSTWLSDLMHESLRSHGPLPEGTRWRKFGRLEVYFPPQEYILALKLLAGRPKDREDILALSKRVKIRTRAQAQRLVDRYLPDQQLQRLSHLDETLDAFF